MFKRSTFVALAVVMALQLVLAACQTPAAPAPTAAPAAQQAPQAAPATAVPAAAKPAAAASTPEKVVWRFQVVLSKNDFQVQASTWWSDQMKEFTGGKFELEIYERQSLGFPGTKINEIVKTGMLPASEMYSSHVAGSYPWIEALDLPGLVPMWQTPEYYRGLHDALWDLWASELAKDNLQLLSISQLPFGRQMFLAKKPGYPWTGLKIRSGAPMISWLLQQLGASPVQMDFAEVPEAVQRGIVDGVDLGHVALLSANLQENLKWVMNQSYGGTAWVPIANKDQFAALPKEWQTKMLELTRKSGEKFLTDGAAGELNSKKLMETKYGGQYFDLPKEGQDKLKGAFEGRWAEWMQKAGPVGQKSVQIIQQYVKDHPPK